MKLCQVCGNENVETNTICQFCGSQLGRVSTGNIKFKLIKTVNIKDDLPTIEQAKNRMEYQVKIAKQQKYRLLKIIHGYGSSGKGGDIRIAIRNILPNLVWQRKISSFINGEELTRNSVKGRNFLSRFSQMKKDSDYNSNNKGVTIIVL